MFLPLCLYAGRETWESPIWWAEKQDARFFVLRSIIIPQRGIHHSDKWWQKVHYEKRQEVSDADELLVLCLCSTLYSFIRWLVQGQMQKHFLHIEGEVILKGLRGKFKKCYTGFKFPCDSSGIGAAWWTHRRLKKKQNGCAGNHVEKRHKIQSDTDVDWTWQLTLYWPYCRPAGSDGSQIFGFLFFFYYYFEFLSLSCLWWLYSTDLHTWWFTLIRGLSTVQKWRSPTFHLWLIASV